MVNIASVDEVIDEFTRALLQESESVCKALRVWRALVIAGAQYQRIDTAFRTADARLADYLLDLERRSKCLADYHNLLMAR